MAGGRWQACEIRAGQCEPAMPVLVTAAKRGKGCRSVWQEREAEAEASGRCVTTGGGVGARGGRSAAARMQREVGEAGRVGSGSKG